MGFWQHLTDSYEKNAETLKLTYPLSTTSISNKSNAIVVIVIKFDGEFVDVYQIDKESKATKKKPGNPPVNITIPASEESLKRTSTAILPYPIFEQFDYLKGISSWSDERIQKFYKHCDRVRNYISNLKKKGPATNNRFRKWKGYNEKIKPIENCGKKFDAYISQLKDFAKSSFATNQVKAIYQYASKRTIASDLSDMNLNDKTNILFQVEIPGNQQAKVWEDETLFYAWHQYYLSTKYDNQALDYVTGNIQPIATFHPKKISNASANAKLVSSTTTLQKLK